MKLKIINYIKDFFLDLLKTVGPIIAIVFLLHFTFIKFPPQVLLKFLLASFMILLGLKLFLKGIKISLLPIGEKIGSELPKKKSISLILVMGFILGFSVTVAEPDVRVLSSQIDLVSNGAINKNIFIVFIGIGIGVFLLISFLRLLLNIPIIYFLFAGYLIILVLSFFTPKQFIAVSFDAGGVTTGPITVPIIMSLGLGIVSVLGGKTRLADGFGLIGIASIGPVITVMLLGIISK